MELWDAYDENLNKIDDMVLIRGEQIPSNCFHLVCEIIVKHKDGSHLIMQRDNRKHFGGMWEATAGGSALQGENPLSCARRELREETGIIADNLVEIGRVLHHGHKSFYVEYLCITDVDKDSIVLQEGETSDYKWITANELRKLSKDELVTQRILNFVEGLN
jgi:8-oxo-dGTP pyrophosphatase MutT (NUDIX family)